jgi:hypothetical protein
VIEQVPWNDDPEGVCAQSPAFKEFRMRIDIAGIENEKMTRREKM